MIRLGLRVDACLMESGLDMATRKRLADRFKAEYAKASKKQKGEILDRLVGVGMGRSTARRLPAEPVMAGPSRPSGRGRRPKYSPEAQAALERLWLPVGMPCGPYMKAMPGQWISCQRRARRDIPDGLGQGAVHERVDHRPQAPAAQAGGGAQGHVAGQPREGAPAATRFASARPPTRSSVCPAWPRPTRSRTAGRAPKASSPGRRRWWTTRPTGPRTPPRATTRNPTSGRPSTRPSPCSRSRAPASTPITAPSPSTTSPSTGCSSATSNGPAAAPTRRTTRPPSNPVTTTSCAKMRVLPGLRHRGAARPARPALGQDLPAAGVCVQCFFEASAVFVG